ncbi:class I SAM-dependent methyltransferase [Aneurinibacillus sp. Ricciae_BoGa-3]|uniref:class I SAM-dependent methyltransferase n=1 Tax=Aneurinibacillus sp. Ricciae_BoGa-3 TaxID=3022697 RepID=UPI0023418BC3|nr:class I SAM-dependent methyltransferase [Aneurinibacillus sp. Ricciae_BoGa-3]WCK53378.1 class I SAM-dependent methyltransferase [Aneurinibacillus sp. Ricciae_BoGa-3]
MDYVDQNRVSFDKLANQSGVKWRHRDLTIQFISAFQMLLGGSRVLDLGCGAGHDSLRLKRYDLQVQGLDISEVMLQQAKQSVQDVEFIQGDFRSIPTGDSIYDGVWANASLIYITKEDLKKALGEVYRVMKPGGVFFSSYRIGEGSIVVNNIFNQLYQQEEIEMMLRSEGFRIFDRINTGVQDELFISLYAVKQ